MSPKARIEYLILIYKRYQNSTKKQKKLILPRPCCGHLVHEREPGFHQTCPICGWEDDLAQLRFPLMPGSSNTVSLLDAQQNYRDYGASERRSVGNTPRPGRWRGARPRLAAPGPGARQLRAAQPGHRLRRLLPLARYHGSLLLARLLLAPHRRLTRRSAVGPTDQ